jgi:HEAT repeat protein
MERQKLIDHGVVPAMSAQKKRIGVRVLAGIVLGLMVCGRHSLSAQAPDELSAVIPQLRDGSPAERKTAGNELVRLLRDAEIRAGEVAKLLKDPDVHVRNGALNALSDAGSEAKDAVPVLVELLRHPDKDVRTAAIRALGIIGAKARGSTPYLRDAGPVMVELLKDPDRYVRQAAASVLGSSFGFLTKDVITPRVVELIKDPDSNVRGNAVRVLGGMGAETREAAPVLIAYLDDADKSMRRSAATALGRIRPEPHDAVPRLVALLRTDPAEDVRRACAESLRRIWPAADNPVPELLDHLNDSEQSVRTAAIESLGRVGPAARTALPALNGLLRDPDPVVRGSAEVAIGYIAAGFWDVYEPDETARHNLENARAILDSPGEYSGRDPEARKSIRNAIERLEAFERSAQLHRRQSSFRTALLASWKAWAIIGFSIALSVLALVLLTRRLRLLRRPER